MSTATRIEEALQRLAAGRDIEPLVRALGFEPLRPGSGVDARAGLGLERDAGIRGLTVVAEQERMLVHLVEFAGDPAPGRLAELVRAAASVLADRHHLWLGIGDRGRGLVIGCAGPDGDVRHLAIEPGSPRRTDIETLVEMAAADGEGGVALRLRHARALDRTRIASRFFADFRAQRTRVAADWSGLPESAESDRQQLALRLLCRLMFLYFLQQQGHLPGDGGYVPALFRRWRRSRRRRRTFFRSVLDPLFFGSLNTRPEQRERRAQRLGDLPYLNGGLFERSALERRHPELDLPDARMAGLFDELLERYRFTAREAVEDWLGGSAAAAIDPEMLSRVFEGLMAVDRRGDTGTFFTPPSAADRLVAAALSAHLAGRLDLEPARADRLVNGQGADDLDEDRRDLCLRAVRQLRVLDPACGSGAFLLGAFSRLAGLRATLERRPSAGFRREVVAESLHGVDVQADAALLCALRIWLALAVAETAGEIAPLPNLDRRIRQGDALLDPLDLIAGAAPGTAEHLAAVDPTVRMAVAELRPLAARYIGSEPGERERLQQRLAALEADLARGWLRAVDRRAASRLEELRRRAAQADLWGSLTADAREAAAGIPRVEAERAEWARLARSIEDTGALPFFSFAVHFADVTFRGFDLILTNPPWVRSHRWPRSLGRLVRRRYEVCRDPGWRLGCELARVPPATGAQVDLAILFLERALRLLAPRGTLGAILPAKMLRSLYGGPARALLLRETTVAAVEDHSLHQHSIFAADSFAATVVASRADPPGAKGARVRISLHRRGGPPLTFETGQEQLPLVPGDPRSPWLLAPPRAVAALRRMQGAGPPLGRSLRVRRGVFTGANDVLVVREARPALGNLAWIRAEGAFTAGRGRRPRASRFEALVEAPCVVPLLRGRDVSAWRFDMSDWVLWVHGDGTGSPVTPPRLGEYLARHDGRLRRRSGVGSGEAAGRLLRVSRDTAGPKVVWRDLARTLEAVAVPARIRSRLSLSQPVVPLNTLYFIPTPAEPDALVLAALFNSMPVRTFVRSVAERAKDARFRFFAWTLAVLPLPPDWRRAGVGPLADIARHAHAEGGLPEDAARQLDARVGAMYGLDPAALQALDRFDRWLSGDTEAA